MQHKVYEPDAAEAASWRDAMLRWTASLDRYQAAAAARVGRPARPLDPEYRRRLLWEKFRLYSLHQRDESPHQHRESTGETDARLWWRNHLLDAKWVNPDISPFSVDRLKPDDPWYPYAEELARGGRDGLGVRPRGAGGGGGGGGGGWEAAVRGWGAAAVLLALLLLLARLSERCLRRPLFKSKRKRSAERSSGNSHNTCHVNGVPDEELGAMDPYAESPAPDAPPPYPHSAPRPAPHPAPCAGAGKFTDEPPPPYSHCVVALAPLVPPDTADTTDTTAHRTLDTGQDDVASNSDESLSDDDDGSRRAMIDDDESVSGDEVKSGASVEVLTTADEDDDVKTRVFTDLEIHSVGVNKTVDV